MPATFVLFYINALLQLCVLLFHATQSSGVSAALGYYLFVSPVTTFLGVLIAALSLRSARDKRRVVLGLVGNLACFAVAVSFYVQLWPALMGV